MEDEIYGSQPTNSDQGDFSMQEKDYINFTPPEHKYIEAKRYESSYFKDNNEEQYVLQRAFQANNFTYLRKLPDNFARNCVLEERKARVQDQISQEAVKRMMYGKQSEKARQEKIEQIRKTKIGSLGYFELFPYQQSDYNIPKKLANTERVQNISKRKEVSDLEFRPNGFDKKMKYQDPFKYIDRLDSTTEALKTKSDYLFPFHLPNDVYDVYHESELRQKIVEEELKIAGDFIPSKTGHALSNQSKSKMPEILNEIEYYFKKIFKDQIGYFIGVNKRDHIEIFFENKYKDDFKVQMALSGMLEHEILSRFALRKNPNRWGLVNSMTTHLEYVVLPPWVKQEELLRTKIEPAKNELYITAKTR